ncbi:MAG: hypothetical protein HYS13_15120 [Planctomycetia bacterium]|nr:hypothetical protein [Planctomycetia bacterium]
MKTKILALSAAMIAAVVTAGSARAQEGQAPWPVMQAGGPLAGPVMQLGYDDYVGPSQASPEQVLAAGGLAALEGYPGMDDPYGVMPVGFRQRYGGCASCGGGDIVGGDIVGGDIVDGESADGGCADCGGRGCRSCGGVLGGRFGRLGSGGVLGGLLDPYNCSACDALWRARVEGLYFDRDVPNANFVFTGLGVARDLNTRDLDFDARSGFRIAAETRWGENSSIEVVYAQIGDEMNTRLDEFGTVALAGGGNFTVFHELIYESTLISGEVNFWRPMPWRFARFQCSWMPAGIRYLNINEDFIYNAIFPDARPTLAIPPGGLVSSTSGSVHTRNHLLGYQLGLWAMIPVTCNLGATFEGKAGIFGNRAEQDTESAFFRGNGTAILAAAEDDNRGQESLIAEINLVATYRLSCNVSTYAGWQALWVSGLALAVEQADRIDQVFNPVDPLIRTNGHSFYNVLRGGVEVVW